MGDKLLEFKLRQHAYDMLAVNTVKEYEDQIGEWKKYINRVVDANENALRNHKSVLNKMWDEEKAKAEANALFLMLAFSLVSGPALSWIGGAIQYSAFPKLTSTAKTRFVHGRVQQKIFRNDSFGGKWVGDASLPIGVFTEDTHNKVVAKIFGDLGADIAQKAGNGVMSLLSSSNKQQIISRQKGNSYQLFTKLANESGSADQFITTLRSRLEAALIDETKKTTDAIINLATVIKRHLNYGKLVLEKLYSVNPRTKNLTGIQLEWAGIKYIEQLVDETREQWAEDWFYYGYNPPNTSEYEMSRRLEREIWALWILDQEFKLKVWHRSTTMRGDRLEFRHTEVKGRDKIPFGDTLLRRLADLNIVPPRTIGQWQQNPTMQAQISGISGVIDEHSELTAIENWAKNHSPELITGNEKVGEIRMLSSIVNHTK